MKLRKALSSLTLLTFIACSVLCMPNMAYAANEDVETKVTLGGTILEEDSYYVLKEYQSTVNGKYYHNLTTEGATSENYVAHYTDGKLTLNGINLTADNENALEVEGNLTIELLGDNTLTSDGSFISTSYYYGLEMENGDLTITGNGNLTLNAADLKEPGESLNEHASIGLSITAGSLIYNGSGTITCNGGDLNAGYQVSRGLVLIDENVNDGVTNGLLTINGGGKIVANAGDSSVGSNIYATSEGANVTGIIIDNGSLESNGGDFNPAEIDEDHNNYSYGLSTDYLKVNDGKVVANGGSAQYSYGAKLGIGSYYYTYDYKIDLTNSTFEIASNGVNYSKAMEISDDQKNTLSLSENSALIADAGDNTSAVLKNAVTGPLDIISTDVMWRYQENAPYAYTGEISFENQAYFEIRNSDGCWFVKHMLHTMQKAF